VSTLKAKKQILKSIPKRNNYTKLRTVLAILTLAALVATVGALSLQTALDDDLATDSSNNQVQITVSTALDQSISSSDSVIQIRLFNSSRCT
jgi:H2-forming N5,N10-methylenetetrahydromethanopterin dehydrogenase-like enzyme